MRTPHTIGTGSPGQPIGVAAAVVVALGLSLPARASDFWDEVRTPGLRHYRVLVEQSQSALRTGRHQEALQKADRAVARMSGRAPAHVLRALALGAMKRYGDALEPLERALELDDRALDDVEQGEAAVRIAMRTAAYELAERILSRLTGTMASGGRRGSLYALQGDLLQLLGPERLSAAILAYRLALREGDRPERPALLLGLALALHREGKPEQAMELGPQAGDRAAAERALRSLPLPPGERAARLAVMLESLGDRDGARQRWSIAAQAGTWREHARRSLASLQEAKGDAKEKR